MLQTAALLLAMAFSGQIDGPENVPIHQIATVSTKIEADGYIWFVFPIEPGSEAIQADPKIFQFTGTPGTHQVCLTPLMKGVPQGKIWKTVVFGISPGPVPPPGPSPDPTPDPLPTPVPINQVLYATMIYDMDRISTSRPNVIANNSIRVSAAELNIIWRAYDDSSTDLAKLNILPSIKDIGVPAIVFQRTDGTVMKVAPCPTTPNSVIDLFFIVRGKH